MNWEDIKVGNCHLDHSENFFGKKVADANELQNQDDLKRHYYSEASPLSRFSSKFEDMKLKDDNKENSPPMPPSKQMPYAKSTKIPVSPNLSKSKSMLAQNEDTTTTRLLRSNVAQQLSAPKGAVATPEAYKFQNRYQHHKNELLRQQLEEESKKRVFRSQPMPNFDAAHERSERKKVVHAVTVPVTPKVLKRSHETDKRKKKLDEAKQIVPQELHRPLGIGLKPREFTLHTERRVLERRQFNIATKAAMEEKQKQLEENRKQRDDDLRRENRKLSSFKARPNPFKQVK